MEKYGKVLLFLLVISISWTEGNAQLTLNDYDYNDQVGYLSPQNEDWSKNFERCGIGLPLGFYSSPAPYIFKENKGKFRKFIMENFNDNNFKDNGLLNLRFLINCNGEIGDVEVNELDFDFERMDLDDALVYRLKELSFRKEHWNYRLKDEPSDYYMYLIYRLENGKVVEILP